MKIDNAILFGSKEKDRENVYITSSQSKNRWQTIVLPNCVENREKWEIVLYNFEKFKIDF